MNGRQYTRPIRAKFARLRGLEHGVCALPGPEKWAPGHHLWSPVRQASLCRFPAGAGLVFVSADSALVGAANWSPGHHPRSPDPPAPAAAFWSRVHHVKPSALLPTACTSATVANYMLGSGRGPRGGLRTALAVRDRRGVVEGSPRRSGRSREGWSPVHQRFRAVFHENRPQNGRGDTSAGGRQYTRSGAASGPKGIGREDGVTTCGETAGIRKMAPPGDFPSRRGRSRISAAFGPFRATECSRVHQAGGYRSRRRAAFACLRTVSPGMSGNAPPFAASSSASTRSTPSR